jgi:hypothetical protein
MTYDIENPGSGFEQVHIICFLFRFVVFKVSFNNMSAISWRSDLLVEETGGPGENHRPVASQ